MKFLLAFVGWLVFRREELEDGQCRKDRKLPCLALVWHLLPYEAAGLGTQSHPQLLGRPPPTTVVQAAEGRGRVSRQEAQRAQGVTGNQGRGLLCAGGGGLSWLGHGHLQGQALCFPKGVRFDLHTIKDVSSETTVLFGKYQDSD